MSPLANFVTLTLTRATVGIRRAGFGKPMILSYSAAWSERGRDYVGLAEVATDFPTTNSPEYLAAEAIFAQTPHPTSIMIGRGANKPTQRYAIEATAVDFSTYGLTVIGDGVTETEVVYVHPTSPYVAVTREKIHFELLSDLNAVVGKNFTATFAALVVADFAFTRTSGNVLTKVAHTLRTGDGPLRATTTGTLPAGALTGTDYYAIRLTDDTFSIATTLENALAGTAVTLTDAGSGTHTMVDTVDTVSPYAAFVVTGSAAGEWFSLAPYNVALLDVSQTHADPGVAADLTAIALEKPGFYCVLTNFNSNACVNAAADWTQSNNRIYVFDTADTDVVTLADGSSDVIDDNQTAARGRVLGQFHPSPADMLSAALAGRVLPIDPGGETWALKPLVGPAPVRLTTTQRDNLTSKYGNSYEELSEGINVTFDGRSGDGDYLDVQRGLDWMTDDISKTIAEILVANNKIVFDDPGILKIAGGLRSSLKRAKKQTIILSFEIEIPTKAEVLAADVTLRTLNGLKFSAVMANAIQKVNVVGSISL